MKVYDVMTPDVVVVGPNATLAEAERLVKEGDAGPFPVCESGEVFGMVTALDIAARAPTAGRDPATTRVRDVVTPYFVCCFDTDEVEEAVRLMEETQFRRLLVIDDARRLVGRVSLDDVVRQRRDAREGGASSPSFAAGARRRTGGGAR